MVTMTMMMMMMTTMMMMISSFNIQSDIPQNDYRSARTDDSKLLQAATQGVTSRYTSHLTNAAA